MNCIGFVGVGRLGICMALCAERAGYNIICTDVNKDMLAAIDNHTLTSYEDGVNEMLRSSTNIRTTCDYHDIFESADVIFVVVPTPSLPNGEYDHSCVDDVVSNIVRLGIQSRRKHLIISCTTMPEYCDTVANRLACYNINVCYNPEFIAQGDIIQGFTNPDMVLIGESDKESGDVLEAIYRRVCKNDPHICRMSLTEAELTKISINCYLGLKIAYANMIGDVVRRCGGNEKVVLDAVGKDSRIGNKFLRYGYGYGGPCLPRDNTALTVFAALKNAPCRVANVIDEANDDHLEEMLTEYMQSPEEIIHFDYVTYKPNTVILDQSFPLRLALELATRGRKVHITESEVVIRSLKDKYGESMFSYTVRK
jgi:UDPglucose 6-dehydrogenase